MLKFALALPVALASWPVLAVAGAETESVVDAGGMLRGLAGLGVVLALIIFAGWLLKRIGPNRLGATGPMRIIASQSLGTRERVVLLEVADQWLVIGVAPGNVRSLATLPRGITPTAPAGPQPSFTTLFNRAIGRGKQDTP